MIPYPGESVGAYSYTNVSGTPIGSVADVRFRAGSSTFGTGDAAKVVVFFGVNYLENDTTPGDVSWCIEITGGAGDLTLTECLGDGTPDVPLGTFTVSGAGPLVVPSTTITMADIYNEVFGSILIECDTGTVDVQQVKLRAWPIGGPVGGWGDLHPAWDRIDFPTLQSAARVDSQSWSEPASKAITPAWAATLACSPSVVGGGTDTTPILVSIGSAPVSPSTAHQSHVRLTANSSVTPAESGGGAILTGTGIVATRTAGEPRVNPDEGLVEGVDYITDPHEVESEPGALAQADTDPVAAWRDDFTIATEDEPGSDPPPVTPLIGALPYSPTVDGVTGDITHLWPDHAAVPPGDLGIPNVDTVLVAPSHGWFRTAPPEPAPPAPLDYTIELNNGFGWAFGNPLRYDVAMPAYRVWQLTTTEPLPLQWSQRADGLALSGVTAWSAGRASRNAAQWRAPL